MSESIDTFNSLLSLAVENGASDIHIKTDKVAMLRLNGSLQPVDMDPLSGDLVGDFIDPIRFAKFARSCSMFVFLEGSVFSYTFKSFFISS